MPSFMRGDLVHQLLRHGWCIRASGTWMFSATVCELEQRAFLEQHAPAHLKRAHGGAFDLSRVTCWPNTSMLPSRGLDQADDGAQQHRLAGARAADHAQHLAAIDVEIDMVVDDLVAEAVDQRRAA